LREIFKRRHDLFISPAFSDIALVLLELALLLLAIRYRNKLRVLIATGRPRTIFDKVTRFLDTPSRAGPYILLISAAILTHNFLSGIHKSYLIGANHRMASQLNTQALQMLPAEGGINKIKVPMANAVCTFYVSRRAEVVRLEYMDFLVLLLFGGEPPTSKVLSRIGELPAVLPIIRSESVRELENLDPKKDTYSREEVTTLLKRAHHENGLDTSPKRARPLTYLEVDYKDGVYIARLFQASETPLTLGKIDFLCSRYAYELRFFHLDHTVRLRTRGEEP